VSWLNTELFGEIILVPTIVAFRCVIREIHGEESATFGIALGRGASGVISGRRPRPH